MTTKAYAAGYEDGLCWDLDGFRSLDDVDEHGWDDATISACGRTAFCEAVGVDPEDDETGAFATACREYNRGAYAGATSSEHHGLKPGEYLGLQG